MKKLLNGITSIVSGALMFILGVCPAFKATASAGSYSMSETASLYESVTEAGAAFETFSIIMMVVAGLLVVSGVIELLKQLKVLKFNVNMSLVNIIILVVLVVSMIGLTISAIVYANDNSVSNVLTISAGVGVWIMDVVPVAGLVVATLFRNKK